MTGPYLVLAIGVLCCSCAAVIIRVTDAPFLVIAAYRLCLASLVIVPVALVRSGNILRGISRRDLTLILCAGAFLALHFATWTASLDYTSVATSVILVTASPVFVAIASYFLFGEKLRRQTVLGIIIAIAGSVIIGYGNWKIGAGSLFGGILALLAALAFAGYLLIGRSVRRRMGFLSYLSLVYGSAALLLLGAALAAGYSLTGYSSTTYLLLVLLAVLPQLIGHSSFNWAVRFMPATVVAIADLGEPIGASVLAFLVLNEAPAVSEYIGGILILAGIFAALQVKKR